MSDAPTKFPAQCVTVEMDNTVRIAVDGIPEFAAAPITTDGHAPITIGGEPLTTWEEV